jgi:hypothetical protein
MKGTDMKTTIETDEQGNIYVPLPEDVIDELTLENLKENYRILCETEGLYFEEKEQASRQAFKTLIDYYGGNLNE